jgi:hypothetical protein
MISKVLIISISSSGLIGTGIYPLVVLIVRLLEDDRTSSQYPGQTGSSFCLISIGRMKSLSDPYFKISEIWMNPAPAGTTTPAAAPGDWKFRASGGMDEGEQEGIEASPKWRRQKLPARWM